MDCHTVVFSAKRTNPGKYNHNELVSLIWSVLSRSKLGAERVQEMHDQYVPSPFTWSFSEMSPQEVVISWCAYPDDIIGAFTDALKSIEGRALTVPGSNYLIKDVYEAEDMQYLPKRLSLHSLSGILVNRRKGDTKKIQPLWYDDDNAEWIKRVESKLMNKVKLYGDSTVEHHAVISNVKMTGSDKVTYNGVTFTQPLYSLKLEADPDTMKVALFAGLGQNTGMCAGHVVP